MKKAEDELDELQLIYRNPIAELHAEWYLFDNKRWDLLLQMIRNTKAGYVAQ